MVKKLAFQLRVTPDELERWREAARSSGRTMSDFLRDGAEGEIRRMAGEPAPEPTFEGRLASLGFAV